MTGDKYKEVIRPFLDDRRYFHSLCVAEEAVKLAKKYGADVEKAYTSGILHDITKQTENETQLQFIQKSNIISIKETEDKPKIYHSKSGAAYVHDVLGIDDMEIVDAIRYHTTARANMSLLETILYIADFTSADRDYSDVSVMRVLADADLNEALKYALSYTITDLVQRRKTLHSDTVNAYDYYINR